MQLLVGKLCNSLSLSPDTKRQLCMQVWILDETSDGDSNIYVHHEVPLSAFPLCTAWLDCPLKGGEKGMIAYTLFFLQIPASPVYSHFLGSPPFFETAGFNVALKLKSGA